MSDRDPTENVRRFLIENDFPEKDLEKATQRWNTHQLQEDFVVLSFLAPFVLVRRKSDGAKGTLEFTHSPRVYFNFVLD